MTEILICLFIGVIAGVASTIACWIELKKLHNTVKSSALSASVAAPVSAPANDVPGKAS